MPTTADYIGKYIALRNTVAALTAEHEERVKPYAEAMQAIEGAVTEEINRLGGESVKTDQGTAYRSTLLAVKVADRELFMDFIFDGRREGFLTSAVAKEAVKEWLDEHNGALPPGIDVTYIYRTNFRKA